MTRTQMYPGRRMLRIGTAAVFALALVCAGASAIAAVDMAHAVTCQAAPAPTADARSIDLSATVVASGSAVACSPAQPAPAGPPRSTGSGSSAPATVAPVAVPVVAAADEFDLGGVLYIGGLSSAFSPSINPGGGEMQLWFTVRNVSASTFDASADFTLDGPFANRIGEVDGVEILELKPGETRTVSASIAGVGQWAFLTAHATLEPPANVDGEELTPVTRDASIFAPPWFIGVLLVIGAAAFIIVRVVRGSVVPARVQEAV
ncbi:hypothetical protein MN032_01395 [Agromyces atrinae]|uniref:hypothetical protein n=1 Tax=Agromyces atrinae TaxID=592376 RepID=UPI001F55DBEC|nr:hypothetical protein [Agromyces atrinae]MCI2956331.1 hypothetical protein [Agromyces atrinae]